ncbi:XRE family transcriptional regulator [Photorhabdus luminescens]|uniref:XRE family transcriptional regulator n=1 Tax=Photorhabdus hindustanensis TaxID=2918802 RepID=A0A0A0CRT0_9GAMM|nr:MULTISPECIES: XRE family transcriptional regulator [Photorhabdus]KGM28415.1 XRE family transcriptional regulator [Photorhabdus luminescens]MBS9430369.1 XRE family transcriptional regulator [Photorhabdus akhurstii]MBS9432959.1 XRE family transcriptional regulator [Photorhabdus hainanensis]MCC8458411.1 XRE family transcriptional regulator [Photorhabdus aegyptia]PQQ22476.1 XRE family transcriptional regulator [Photorhabdus hindustanensis]
MTTKIDTEIRKVTPTGHNIFSELGFTEQEAQQLHATSLREIEKILKIKEQLMEEITLWIVDKKMKQAEAATVLNISRPRVSDVVNKKVNKFTIDALVNMLTRIGKPVQITVG